MIDKQTQALKRLTKKLSALRTTLRKDERDLLDQLILGASADVAGHALTSAISTEAVTSRPTEVAAHAMTSAVSSIREAITFDSAKAMYKVKARAA